MYIFIIILWNTKQPQIPPSAVRFSLIHSLFKHFNWLFQRPYISHILFSVSFISAKATSMFLLRSSILSVFPLTDFSILSELSLISWTVSIMSALEEALNRLHCFLVLCWYCRSSISFSRLFPSVQFFIFLLWLFHFINCFNWKHNIRK